MKRTKYGKPRDQQRSRVYDAENKINNKTKSNVGGRLETVADVEQWVEKIRRSVWFRNRWPFIREIRIKDGRGTRNGFAWASATTEPLFARTEPGFDPLTNRYKTIGFLNLPVWSRSRLVILHELAHIVTNSEYMASRGYKQTPVAGHGPEFCSVYLALVRRYLGEPFYLELRENMRSRNVKIGRAPKPFPMNGREPLPDREPYDDGSLLGLI